MDEQVFQNIKDWVDEFKIAIVDYPNTPNLSWIVEYVPLLIATIEASQAIGKIWQEQEADLRRQLADAVEMLAEEGFAVTDEKGLEYVTLRKQLAKAQEVLEVYAHESNWSSCAITEMETGEYPNVDGFSDTRTVEIDLGIDVVWCNNDEGKLYARQVLGLEE